jgi:hypothetical protein
MKQASEAISSWGAIGVLPFNGPKEVGLILGPYDAPNVSLEYGVVKLFVET